MLEIRFLEFNMLFWHKKRENSSVRAVNSIGWWIIEWKTVKKACRSTIFTIMTCFYEENRHA